MKAINNNCSLRHRPYTLQTQKNSPIQSENQYYLYVESYTGQQ